MSNELQSLESVEAAWGVQLPKRFAEVYDRDSWYMIELPDGHEYRCPGFLLNCSEIVSAKTTAEDWEIRQGLVPFMGDFHDLLCLDYRSNAEPSITLLDDARNEKKIFESIDGLLDAPKIEEKTERLDTTGIDAGKSYLNF